MLNRRQVMRNAFLGLGSAALGGSSLSAASTIAAPRPVGVPTANPFGVNLHLDRFPSNLALKQLMQAKAMGIGGVRGVGAAWGYVQPSKQRWEFQQPDRDLDLISMVDLEPLGCLGPTVAWASSLDPNSAAAPSAWSVYPPDDLDAWGEYVTRVVERYKGRIRVWSPFNEPDSYDFFWPESRSANKNDEAFLVRRRAAFLRLQQVTYQAAKKADPSCLVLSGGFALGGRCDSDFVPWLIRNGICKWCDVMDIHMYWSVDNIRSAIRRTRQWLADEHASKPIWMTEVGASLRSENDEIGAFDHAQLQSFVPRVLVTAMAMDVQRLFWYQGYTEGNSAASLADSAFSLNVTDGPTPAAWSFANTIRLLRGATYLGEAALETASGSAEGYCFRTIEGEAIILWATSPDKHDNRSAQAAVALNWQQRRIPLVLSERPTVLMGRSNA